MVYFIVFYPTGTNNVYTVSRKQLSSACQDHLFQWCRKVVKSGEAILLFISCSLHL